MEVLCSKAVFLLLLIRCFMYSTLFIGALCLVFVLLYSFELHNHPGEEERAGYFTLIVFLMSSDCLCSVALPHGAVGWSAVCECCIS